MRRLLTFVLVAVVAVMLYPSPATAGHRQVGAVNDPAFVQGLQWNLSMVGAPQAWRAGRGKGITIGVIDSGIDLSHEDLAPNVVGNTACIGTGGDPGLCNGSGADDNGHGTHVAGIAAAVTGNGVGVAGVAPDAKLLAIRVLTDHCKSTDCSAEGDSSDVAAGVRWAVARGARVINLSLGSDASSLTSPVLADALRFAWAHGAVPVIASGNAKDQPLDVRTLPAVVVTAVGRDGRVAGYANAVGQSRWALAAPGGNPGDSATTCRTGGVPNGVLSTYWDPKLGPNQYACLAGTSMAAPHVSGALAILLGLGFTPSQAVERLLQTADPVPGSNPLLSGAGRLDIARAIALGKPAPAPLPPPASPNTAAVAAAARQAATPLPASHRRRRSPPSTQPAEDRLVPAAVAGMLIALVALAQIAASRRREPA